jgi:galactokinase
MLMDCSNNTVAHVPMPDSVEVVVVHSGQQRELRGSQYAVRRMECEQAEAEIGPLRDADLGDTEALGDSTVAARARHVISENRRVADFTAALESGEFGSAGRIMCESHLSLRNDFEVSTPALDQLVDALTALPGVLGARLSGAGFGGAVVALCEAGTAVPGNGVSGEVASDVLILGRTRFPNAFVARPSAGAMLLPRA